MDTSSSGSGAGPVFETSFGGDGMDVSRRARCFNEPLRATRLFSTTNPQRQNRNRSSRWWSTKPHGAPTRGH